MSRLFRREFAADVAVGSYALLYFAWLAIRPAGTPLTQTVGAWAFYPLGFVVGWAFWRTSGVGGLDRRTRAAWRLLGFAALWLWFTGTAWTLYVMYGGSVMPAWVSDLEIIQSAAAIVAFLLFPGQRIHRRDRARWLLDAGLIVVTGFSLAVYFGFSTRVNRANPIWSYDAVDLVVDWAMFTAAATATIQKRDRTTRRAAMSLVLAYVTTLAANHWLAIQAAYVVGNAVDGFWFGAWILKWTAARVAWHRYRRHGVGGADSERPRGYRSGLVPYLVVAGAFGLLFLQALSGHERFLELLAASTALTVGLLVVRQTVQLAENHRLFESQIAREARFRSLIQHSSDVVLVIGHGGLVSYVSPSAWRIFGLRHALSAGTPLADILPPGDAQALAGIASGRTPAIGRLLSSMPTETGERRDVEIVWTDLRHNPSIGGIVLNCRDITERNEIERQLRHAQKLDAVGHLAGGLAHDLNNVLMTIRGYTELLGMDVPAGSVAAQHVTEIERAVDRAAGVTKKLLAFSRRQAVQPGVIDLNTVVHDLEPLIRQILTSRTSMQVNLQPGLWQVMADRGQMEQVLINLATNARDAMPGGGTLRITTANTPVRTVGPDTGRTAPGDYVSLVVADAGVGMSEEVRARIFEPFFTTKPQDRGIGLGLPMVHGIVTASGGTIVVQSAPGRGSRFTILLPRTAELTAPASAPAAPSMALTTGTGTILLVDDEPGVRATTRRMLERAGYRVVEAPGGAEALEMLASGSATVDVLLTDMIMPGMHGRDLIARFAQIRPGVPIVVMTGFSDDAVNAPDQSALIKALITKPFSADALLRAIALAR